MKLDLEKIFDRLPAFWRRHLIAKLLLRISPQSAVQLVKFNRNAKLYADIRDPLPRTYFLTQSFDAEFIQVAKTFIPENGIYFDGGANVGFCTFGLLPEMISKQVTAHLFEANPDLCRLLEKSKQLHLDQKIHITCGALSDSNGSSHFHINLKHLGASYVEHGPGKTPHIRLDDYLKSHNIPRVDFFKMDLEGYEPAVLKGAENALRNGVFKTIFTEVSSINLARYGWRPQDLLKRLHENHYQLFWIKKRDFQLGICKNEKKIQIKTERGVLEGAMLSRFPNTYQTDILAIHESANTIIQ